MAKRKGPASTEVDAYVFIKDSLAARGWDVRNPERIASGEVWTQNECLSNDEIRKHLGLLRPENIVRVNETALWVIEAKRDHSQMAVALSEAEDYARLLNQSGQFRACLVTGVAGNAIDTFLIQTRILIDDQFVPVTINGAEATGFLAREDCRALVEAGRPNLDNPTVDDRLFLARANRINEILHFGAVNPHQRAGVMAALLLAMLSNTMPNIDEPSPTVLIEDINSRVKSVLTQQGKSEFFDLIKISLPTTPDNHVKFRRAIVDTIQELNVLNIRSAMNSGDDWLGAFYEVFLKYANWAQDLGIVLTPRHVTKLVAGVMDIQPIDIVLDPTCGTGGFLVAAFDQVRQNSDAQQIERFKQHGIFGIEQDAGIAALAVVNMIFRGDGKNNIVEGNCFAKFLAPASVDGTATARYVPQQAAHPPVTKVMMNPPFALKKSDEKEYKFINQALAQMQQGGILFSVLPYSALVRPGRYKTWRREILVRNNTIMAVVTLPPDLFYPIGVTSVGIFIRKGIPHPPGQRVLWVRAVTDGLVISKGKRLPRLRAPNDLAKYRDHLQAFLPNPAYPAPGIHQAVKACPIDLADDHLELVPEVYLDQAEPSDSSIATGLDSAARDMLAYLVKTDHAVFRPELITASSRTITGVSRWTFVRVTDLFDLDRGDFHSIKNLDPGPYVTVSRVGTDNGFVGFYDKPADARTLAPGLITVSSVTGDAFLQPIPFIATDNVVLCSPREDGISLEALFFLRLMMDQVKWRYSYGRQCYKTKYAITSIPVPATEDGGIDWPLMETMVRETRHWSLLLAAFGAGEELIQEEKRVAEDRADYILGEDESDAD